MNHEQKAVQAFDSKKAPDTASQALAETALSDALALVDQLDERAAEQPERIATRRMVSQLRKSLRDLSGSLGLSVTESTSCTWSYSAPEYTWNAGCGASWSFHDDGPVENGMNFCHSCGKRLTAAAVELEDD